MKKFLALSLSDVVVIMLMNVNMPTIVGILTFMSRINFVLFISWILCIIDSKIDENPCKQTQASLP